MRDAVKAIADAVIEKGGRLLSWLWFSRYDETPQRLRVLDESLTEEFPSIFGRSKEAGDRIKEAHINATFKDTAPQKLCFYELILAITVRIGPQAFASCDAVNDWLSNLPNRLQTPEHLRARSHHRVNIQRTAHKHVSMLSQCRAQVLGATGAFLQFT